MTARKPAWKDEDALWEWLAPQLRGRWSKIEAEFPPGIPDSFGLWEGQAHWCELKLGKPSIEAFETSQLDFGMACRRHRVPWWVCFGHQGSVIFFDHPGLDGGPKRPPFWAPKPELISDKSAARSQRSPARPRR